DQLARPELDGSVGADVEVDPGDGGGAQRLVESILATDGEEAGGRAEAAPRRLVLGAVGELERSGGLAVEGALDGEEQRRAIERLERAMVEAEEELVDATYP